MDATGKKEERREREREKPFGLYSVEQRKEEKKKKIGGLFFFLSFPIFFYVFLSAREPRVSTIVSLVSDTTYEITFSFRENQIPVETASFSVSSDDHR